MDEGKQDEANEASNVKGVEDLHTTERSEHKANDCRVFCRLTCRAACNSAAITQQRATYAVYAFECKRQQ